MGHTYLVDRERVTLTCVEVGRHDVPDHTYLLGRQLIT